MELKKKTIANDEKFLRQISEEVDFEVDDYLEWISQIKSFCKNNLVYGLALVEIGIPKRIIYLRNTSSEMKHNSNPEYDEEQVFINPKIIAQKGRTRFLERCSSCLNYVGIVERPYSVEVEYYTIEGKRVTEIFEGFKATVFSHELDHLNGILHIDWANNVQEMSYEETREYRNANPYEILSKDEEYKLEKIIKI